MGTLCLSISYAMLIRPSKAVHGCLCLRFTIYFQLVDQVVTCAPGHVLRTSTNVAMVPICGHRLTKHACTVLLVISRFAFPGFKCQD